MPDSVPAEIHPVKGKNIFGRRIRNRLKCTEFPLHRLFPGKEIRHLNKAFLSLPDCVSRGSIFVCSFQYVCFML